MIRKGTVAFFSGDRYLPLLPPFHPCVQMETQTKANSAFQHVQIYLFILLLDVLKTTGCCENVLTENSHFPPISKSESDAV